MRTMKPPATLVGSSCQSVRESAIERWFGTGRVKSPQKSVEDSFVVTSLTKDGCDSKGGHLETPSLQACSGARIRPFSQEECVDTNMPSAHKSLGTILPHRRRTHAHS